MVQITNDDIARYYKKYQHDLIGLSIVKLGNKDDAEEVVQEVFAEFLRNPTRMFESDDHVKNYLEKAVWNRTAKTLRSHGAQRHPSRTLGRAVNYVGDDQQGAVDGSRYSWEGEDGDEFNAILDVPDDQRMAYYMDENLPLEDDYSEDSFP